MILGHFLSRVETMARENYLIVLTVLCAVSSFEAKKQLSYDYIGTVIASNKVSEGLSKWSISGDLTIQHLDDHQIFKLNNLKTTIFNGLQNVKEPERKDPLESIEDITKPFAVYYHSIDNVEITVDPAESFWSRNMKKAIASAFHVDTTAENGFEGVEQTLYGKCTVKYETDTDAKSKIINKIIDHNTCVDSQESNWYNVKKVDLNVNHSSTTIETKRFYLLHKTSGDLDFVRSESNLTYQNTPSMENTHLLQQAQTYTLTNTVTEFEPLTVASSATEKESLLWNSEQDDDKPEITQEQIIQVYKEALTGFKTQFNKRLLEKTNISSPNYIEAMFSSLSELNTGDISTLISDDVSANPEDDHILISLLPYIGTNHTSKLIKDYIKTDYLNDLLFMKLLATFPTYINSPNQEILNQFEFLMNLENVVSNIQVRYAGILSFASLMSDTFDRGEFDQEFLVKTVLKYQKKLISSEKYEEKLVYLLGLINAANCMKEDLILDIITDPDLDENLRPLAILGFKKHLSNPTEEDVFKQIWPLVQNASENFEVRVAALDLLLSSNLTEEQFNTILHTYEKKPANPFEEHLTNYLFTTIQSLENSDSPLDYIGNFAKARFEKGNIPRYTRSWTTGNYHLSFYDDQTLFGASLATTLIGSPVTNMPSIVHASYNKFEMSLALDSYTIYVKLGGVIDTLLESYLNGRSDDNPINQLLDIIKKCGCEMKSGKEIHVDVAVFSQNRAVFGIHIDQDNVATYQDNLLFLDLIKLLGYYQSIKFPLINFTRFPSDLGTTVDITEEREEAVSQETDNFEQIVNDEDVKEMTYHYKSTCVIDTMLKSRNPLVKTSIAVSKQITEKTSVNFPFKFNTSSNELSWKNHKDLYQWVSDRNIFTTVVDDDTLKHYCPDCDEYYAVPFGEVKEHAWILKELGLTINSKKHNNIQLLADTQEYSHHSNAFVFPPAKPFMFFWNLFNYLEYRSEVDSISVNINPAFTEEYESVLEFNIIDNSIVKDNDPLDTDEIHAYISLKNQKLNGDFLSGVNTTIKAQETTTLSGDKDKPHVEHNFAFYIDIYHDNGNFTKFAVNREILYPSKRSDKLSLKPVKPAKGKVTVAWGAVESLDDYPEQYLKFTELYTATDIQNRKAEEMKEYKKCKKDSAGFKYVPPTRECVAAHKALSRYDFYGLYVDLTHTTLFKDHDKFLEPTKLGYRILESTHIEEGLLNVTMNEEFRARYLAIPDSNFIENSEFFDFLSVDPTAVAYDDYDIYAGIASTCVITPNTIETFTGVHETSFTNKQEEIIAYIECINNTRAGLTVQKLNNKAVGFKMWSGDNLFIVTSENGKLSVTLNGTETTHTPETQDEEFKFYFLEEDVLYVVDSLVEVYYTTEYISIKAASVYDTFICGRCTYHDKK